MRRSLHDMIWEVIRQNKVGLRSPLASSWTRRFIAAAALFSLMGISVGTGLMVLVENLTAAPVSLKEMIAQTEKNAALNKEFDALHRIAQSKLDQVTAQRWLPKFEARVLGGVVPDAKVDPNNIYDYSPRGGDSDFSFSRLGPFLQVKVEAVQPIFTFGKISAYQNMADHAADLASLEAVKKRHEVRQLVKKTYYTLLLAQDSIRVLDDVESRLNQAAEKVEEMLIKNAENVSETDRLKIRVFLADVKNRRLDAERARSLSRSALSELANLSGSWEPADQSLQTESVETLKKEQVISAALRARPELLQLQHLVEVKEAEYRTVRADLFPTLFMAGELGYARAPGRTNINNPYLKDDFNYFNYGVALGLKQDLGFFKTKARMDELRAEADKLAAQRDQLSLKVRLDAEKAFEEAMAARAAIEVNEEGFRAARSWLTSAGLSFNLGTAETKEILESYAAYFKAKADLIRSIYTLDIALADLSFTVGLELADRLKTPGN